jgi:glycerol-3-phosphate dehydrogenase
MLRLSQLAQAEPLIGSPDVAGAGRYFDATVDDARLTLLTVKSAHQAGAVVANYAEAVGLLKAGSKIAGAQVRDAESGREIEVKARAVVNAAGPWVDQVLGLDAPIAKSMLRPTKGAHLIVSRSKLPVREAVVMRSPRDHRAIFIIPWGDFSIVGTTDTDYTCRLEDVKADRDDCDYLLESVRSLMPGVEIDLSDVISTFAGVRPLVADDTDDPSAVSREHAIVESKSGLITIAGGKYTTHRAMAEQLVDRIQRKLLLDSGIAPKSPCVTWDRLLVPPGEITLPDVPEKTARHLIESYGVDVIEVLRLAGQDTALAEPIDAALPYLRAEAVYAVENEMAVTLCDVLMRRTHVLHESIDGALLQSGLLAGRLGALLGWDDVRMQREVVEYEKQVGMARAFR